MISRCRVLVECAFGRLKARFPGLTLMGAVNDMADLYQTVGALFILHNVCFDYHDTVTGLADAFTQAALERIEQFARGEVDELDEPEGGDPLYDAIGQERPEARDDGGGLVEEDLLRQGELFRERCVDILVPE
jgi:hypothetical protein